MRARRQRAHIGVAEQRQSSPARSRLFAVRRQQVIAERRREGGFVTGGHSNAVDDAASAILSRLGGQHLGQRRFFGRQPGECRFCAAQRDCRGRFFGRKAGAFENSDRNFAEFQWANFFRKRGLLDDLGRDGMPDALVKAVKLAQSSAAKKLPGYGKLNLGERVGVIQRARKKGKEVQAKM